MNKNIPTIIAAGILVFILVFYMVTYQVRFTETVVLTTFGKPSDPVTEPGVYAKWPWPIQRVVRYDRRRRILEGVEEELRTKDEQNLVVRAFAEWEIQDPMRFRESVGTVRSAERQLRRLLDTHKKTAIGRHDLANFFSKNQEELKYGEVETETLGALQKDAKEQFGVHVSSVGIKRISLPAGAPTEQVLNRMREEQNRLAAESRAAGEAEKARIEADAESASNRILAFANQVAEGIRTQGYQAAAKLTRAYAEHETLARFLLQLKHLETNFTDRVVWVLGEEHPGIRMIRALPSLDSDGSPAAMANTAPDPDNNGQMSDSSEPQPGP